MNNIYDLKKTGEIIQKRRKQLHLSLEALAKTCFTTRQTVSKWEKGTGEMTFEQASILCNALGCDMGHLLGEYPELTRQASDICKQTGLSESAVTTLLEWKSSEDRRKFYPDYLSRILDADEAEYMFGCIAEYLTYHRLERDAFDNNDRDFAMELQSMQMARLWSISKDFSNIVEMKLSADEYREEDESNGKA